MEVALRSRWNDAEAGRTPLEQLVYMSRIMGQDDALVLWGGGNTSVKVTDTDLLGRPIQLLLIKGSGSDMKAVRPTDFPAVRLEEIRASMTREDMSDAEMVAYLARCMDDPSAPRPSIETLLHGYLAADAVAHSHADAILSLTNTEAGRETVRRVYGDSVAVVDYRRPGFALAKEVSLRAQDSGLRGVVLMNHGLITWGDTARAAYEQHVTLVTEAEDFINCQRPPSRTPARARLAPTSVAAGRDVAARVAPALRAALSTQARKILRFDDSPDILKFLESPRARELAAIGPATPDHLLNTKRHPLFAEVGDPRNSGIVVNAIRRELDGYVQRYVDFYERYHSDEPLLDPAPRVVLVRGLGMWTAGRDVRSALIPADIYHHTIDVMAGAEAVDRYASLSEKDAFEAEYWPLELYKLTLAPPERELARRIVLVTGGARGIGAAIARRLAREGAHVVITDLNEAGAEAVAAEIVAAHGTGHAIAARLDVTDEESVASAFRLARLTYGGLDVLVSNAGVAHVAPIDSLSLTVWEQSLAVNATGHFLVAREALRLFKEQGLGGGMVFVATKNVPAPGKDFGAYSAAKAAEAQLARVLAIEGGESGIRVNMVNPDAVFEDSGLWSEDLRQQRASAYGIRADDLEDFYRQRNLLRVRVTPDDVAEAVLWLASDRSAKTTGAMIPVDGGVREAFPR
ncbi:MAG: bifunctional rhamnulose-1-phosphate aldolase/short-chain dehydrogenase [Chloroflexi bacterium]|nr:bifunctional rhamnulose-1-phosphate aldolase/short-chain dehydrogenase [Chloroflexota bacterium]